MHPAPSVIIFSVLSGMGFGLLAYLGAGLVQPSGWLAFLWWGIGYALAVIGLLAATFHLGNPKNAPKAFSQWRSSWLSREAWAAVATLALLAPMAVSDWLSLGLPRQIGWLGAGLAMLTVFTTSMIYAQIAAVPRWNHWTTPMVFVGFTLTGGALLGGYVTTATVFSVGLGAALLAAWRIGDGLFAARGVTIGTATGLDRIGDAQVFELPHTGGNYLLREMIFVVGRKHATKLRMIAMALITVLPVVALLGLPNWFSVPLATLSHVGGAFAARWLFFAQAEHVVGLYYGKR